MWADAVTGAETSKTAAATQIPILFIVSLSVVSCFLFRVPVIRIPGSGAAVLRPKKLSGPRRALPVKTWACEQSSRKVPKKFRQQKALANPTRATQFYYP
jgi:hypothetical protein